MYLKQNVKCTLKLSDYSVLCLHCIAHLHTQTRVEMAEPNKNVVLYDINTGREFKYPDLFHKSDMLQHTSVALLICFWPNSPFYGWGSHLVCCPFDKVTGASRRFTGGACSTDWIGATIFSSHRNQ